MINEQLFFAQNPWQTGKWSMNQQLIRRSIQSKLIAQIKDSYIQILTGARRTGKTTLMWQFIDHILHHENVPPKNIFYLNFDDIELRSQLRSNPHLLLEIV